MLRNYLPRAHPDGSYSGEPVFHVTQDFAAATISRSPPSGETARRGALVSYYEGDTNRGTIAA